MTHARVWMLIPTTGSGSILAALRIDAPLVVVPNPELLDNHQVELAEAVAEKKWAIHGHLESGATCSLS